MLTVSSCGPGSWWFVGGFWQDGVVMNDSAAHVPGADLPATAAETTFANPWPLRLLSANMRRYIDRMSEMWVEGQVVEYRSRGATKMAFFTLRDVAEDVSMTVTAFGNLVARVGPGFDEGARVVVKVKPNFWEQRGQLSLRASDIRLQGIGSLLAQIEQLRKQLAAEGLFEASRKVPLPFLPRKIGLVCGRDAKAKDDVLVNAAKRWPSIRFVVHEVAVQGQYAVAEVSDAIERLDAEQEVDVIIVARGGGSVEDLLPFSDEHLVRVAAACRTPLVSAIGHEGDAPLLDLVADYRASTPTDAARRAVPDYLEEMREVAHLRMLAASAFTRILTREREVVDLLTSRPVLQSPTATIDNQLAGLDRATDRLRQSVTSYLSRQETQVAGLSATLTALSPTATLHRGYAIMRTPTGKVVREAEELQPGALLEGMLASGTFVSKVVEANPEGTFLHPDPNAEAATNTATSSNIPTQEEAP